ncbi:hypothetical protein I4F81_010043 [Pyropia yezoensis]|uniref:Uncharacterized protein n=1 Tax=Pyropia yezoensis TaxID=2788 RepID=A0ACC3CC12_PYRYE|nr:hypothetical protein I4F81_010043 [Neopyropia yezoensis]
MLARLRRSCPRTPLPPAPPCAPHAQLPPQQWTSRGAHSQPPPKNQQWYRLAATVQHPPPPCSTTPPPLTPPLPAPPPPLLFSPALNPPQPALLTPRATERAGSRHLLLPATAAASRTPVGLERTCKVGCQRLRQSASGSGGQVRRATARHGSGDTRRKSQRRRRRWRRWK